MFTVNYEGNTFFAHSLNKQIQPLFFPSQIDLRQFKVIIVKKRTKTFRSVILSFRVKSMGTRQVEKYYKKALAISTGRIETALILIHFVLQVDQGYVFVRAMIHNIKETILRQRQLNVIEFIDIRSEVLFC